MAGMMPSSDPVPSTPLKSSVASGSQQSKYGAAGQASVKEPSTSRAVSSLSGAKLRAPSSQRETKVPPRNRHLINGGPGGCEELRVRGTTPIPGPKTETILTMVHGKKSDYRSKSNDGLVKASIKRVRPAPPPNTLFNRGALTKHGARPLDRPYRGGMPKPNIYPCHDIPGRRLHL